MMLTREMRTVFTALAAVCAVLLFVSPLPAYAGSLDPPPNAVDGSSIPVPTMKTLDQIPPTWSIKLPASERFVVLADFNNEAVLDKETGLVWEKEPSIFDPLNTLRGNFYQCIYDCISKEVGGRKGWHLPSVEQLLSLFDSTQLIPLAPALPAGHPFINVQDAYWTISTSPNGADRAYVVHLNVGVPNSLNMFKSTERYPHWCVRGGQTYDAY